MNYLDSKLKKLEEIASNPNLNGGVYKSFSLFISIADDILKNRNIPVKSFSELGISEENVYKDLEDIRMNFEKKFGFALENNDDFGAKFQKRKSTPATGRKFTKDLSKFLESYQKHFIWFKKLKSVKYYSRFYVLDLIF